MSATGPEEWPDFGCLSCIRWEGVYLGAAPRAYGRELQKLCIDMVPRHQSSERWVLFSKPTAQPGRPGTRIWTFQKWLEFWLPGRDSAKGGRTPATDGTRCSQGS